MEDGMSRADEIFIQNCREILDHGTWDTDLPVRPRWEDGTPAHTVKRFGIVNRYDLSDEFPILTIRRTYWKSAIDELLWIWQAKSNNVHDLRARVWDAWADENGSIGKAYGYQLRVKHHYPEGDMDQVDKVLWDLKNNPSSRRIMTNIYNFADLSEMALYPCAYSMTFNVCGKKLNAILNAPRPVTGCTLYVSLFPCNECAKAIIQSGIRRIVYESDKYADTDSTKASRRMLEAAGVELQRIENTIHLEVKKVPNTEK